MVGFQCKSCKGTNFRKSDDIDGQPTIICKNKNCLMSYTLNHNGTISQHFLGYKSPTRIWKPTQEELKIFEES